MEKCNLRKMTKEENRERKFLIEDDINFFVNYYSEVIRIFLIKYKVYMTLESIITIFDKLEKQTIKIIVDQISDCFPKFIELQFKASFLLAAEKQYENIPIAKTLIDKNNEST